MKIIKKFKYYFINLIIFLVFLALQNFAILAQKKQSNNLYSSKLKEENYEIGKIVFNGNYNLKTESLSKVLSTKSTQRSLPHRLISYYYNSFLSTGYDINYYTSRFKNALIEMADEIKYFDELKVKNDLITLQLFYSQQGYHDAQISYTFGPDTILKYNVLTFKINENNPYLIKSLKYEGLNSIESEIYKQIQSNITLKEKDIFNEYTLMNDLNLIYLILRDNGYFYAKYDVPEVFIDSTNYKDSVIVNFSTGKRQRIGSINFIDSTKGQKFITNDMKKSFIEMENGDYFNATKMRQSEANLMNLGTFEITKIDTVRNTNESDTVLNFNIFTQYRKQQEYGVGLFLNTSPSSNFLNYGFEVSYTHKNFGGIAQEFNPFAKLLLKSIGLSNLNPVDYEYQLGVNFSQPLIFTIDKAFVGVGTQLLFSKRTMDTYLQLETYTLPIRFPFRITTPQTYFRMGNIEFTFERQKPLNYSAAINSAYNDSNINKIEIFRNYKNLDNFFNNYNPILSSNIIGGSLFGDTRDNPFSPTKGYFSGIFIDATNPIFGLIPNFERYTGLSKYFRLQITNYWFNRINEKAIFALKARLGWIYWYDKAISYIPIERQFFAGGANSNRGWSSRRLRYVPQGKYKEIETNTFALDYVGNGTLIESSFEYRHTFGRLPALGAIGEFLENAGFVVFADIGNTFQWMIVDSTNNYKYKNEWYEYITGLALASGVGFRYDTPVGPIRFDFALPIYDPSLAQAQFILGRKNILENLQIHFALGHAF